MAGRWPCCYSSGRTCQGGRESEPEGRFGSPWRGWTVRVGPGRRRALCGGRASEGRSLARQTRRVGRAFVFRCGGRGGALRGGEGEQKWGVPAGLRRASQAGGDAGLCFFPAWEAGCPPHAQPLPKRPSPSISLCSGAASACAAFAGSASHTLLPSPCHSLLTRSVAKRPGCASDCGGARCARAFNVTPMCQDAIQRVEEWGGVGVLLGMCH